MTSLMSTKLTELLSLAASTMLLSGGGLVAKVVSSSWSQWTVAPGASFHGFIVS